MWIDRSPASRGLAIGIASLGLMVASPASAASEPQTRIVSCGSGNCLLVSGRRDDAAAQVAINGQAVAVEGGRNWRVRVPVTTLRAWTTPLARSIEVSVDGASAEADLPIGMLMNTEHLAMLTITAK